MKCNRFKIFLLSACTMFAFGCGDSGDSGNDKAQPGTTNKPGDIVSVQNRTVSGVSQKGPFVTGSTVTVQELNGESLLQTGISFKGKISNDKGEFKVASINLASQYAFLEVNGYYRNEVTGSNSTSPIIMNALADISDRENVNINLLTHLETDRVMHLVTVDGKSFAEAKNQARKELLGYFGIDGNLGAAEDMSIFGQSDDSAALLAISIIVQGNLRESEFTERLARISGDIADGTIDNPEIWQQMATSAMAQNLRDIRLNVESWGEQVPDFEKYVKSFWRDKLGQEQCDTIGEIKKYENVDLICREDGWDRANNREVLENILGLCDIIGNIKEDIYSTGVCDEMYKQFVCKDNGWECADIQDINNYLYGVCDEVGKWAEGSKPDATNYHGAGMICGKDGWHYANNDDIGTYLFGPCENIWDINHVITDGEVVLLFVCTNNGWNAAFIHDDAERVANDLLGWCNINGSNNINEQKRIDGIDEYITEHCGTESEGIDGIYICTKEQWWKKVTEEPNVCGNGICDPGEEKENCPLDCEESGLCGNGTLDVGEACDDGNRDSGDGCNSLCRIEYGYTCNQPGSPCVRPICGNGLCENLESPYNCPSDCKPNWECNDEDAYIEQNSIEANIYNETVCNENNLEEVKEYKLMPKVFGDCRYTYYHYTCKGYGNDYHWEKSSQEEILNYLGTCHQNDEIKEMAYTGCYVCKNNQWSSNESDFVEYILGPCYNKGDIKKVEYSTKCFAGYNYGSDSVQYMMCNNGSWSRANSNDIPPGKCNTNGDKRRMDGVCYVCESSRWTQTDCE